MKKGKIAIIIAYNDYQDIEYGESKKIFEENGLEVKIVSSKLREAKGKLGGRAKVDLILDDLNVGDYEAIVFIGGPGAFDYIENEKVHRIAREAMEKNKILAAICIAPAILAKAGVLKNRKATVWNSFTDRSAINILKENGAFFENKNVIRDENIITANSPKAAKEFAQTILEAF